MEIQRGPTPPGGAHLYFTVLWYRPVQFFRTIDFQTAARSESNAAYKKFYSQKQQQLNERVQLTLLGRFHFVCAQSNVESQTMALTASGRKTVSI